MPHAILERLSAKLLAHRQAGLERTLLSVRRQGKTVFAGGHTYLNFSSNDFLGLAQNPALAQTLSKLCATQGCGSGASRLITGTSASTLEAEKALADYFGYEACLILGSGFVANLTLLDSLFAPHDTLLLDKRAHASTVAGVRSSHARFQTFHHNDLSHARKLLSHQPIQALFSESLFSMDADSPDFAALKALKDDFGFFCIVDEAHAFGVLGQGRGLASGVADVAVGTLGKAFGLFGAFVLGPETVRQALINFGQGFIYTTALPPWHGDMVLAALQEIRALDNARHALLELADTARSLLREAGMRVHGRAHILRLEIGAEDRAQNMAAQVRKSGILVFAARYPTVPLGQASLRVCLTANHTVEDILCLRDALVQGGEI